MKRGISTPWGESEGQTVAVPGIVFHSTAGHGGFHLSPERQAAVRQKFPGFRTFAGGPWYEEDNDWAVVVLTFPELFDDNGKIERAIKIARMSHEYNPARWEPVIRVLDGRQPRQDAFAFAFDESEVGGVFDGFGVVSDADPGL